MQNFVADIIIANDSEVIEIEVKISESDLLADFTHKGDKHTAYLDKALHITSSLSSQLLSCMPNRFFYAVPGELSHTALEAVRGTPYGLLLIDPHNNKWSKNSFTKIAKQASVINNTYPKDIVTAATARMSSEIINLYETLLDIS
jgi:hypothetical protein